LANSFRLCLDGIAGFYLGLKQGFPHLWAVLRAHFGFYAQASEPGNETEISEK
jgi:hypothetical protein